jgi:hypothetical protein
VHGAWDPTGVVHGMLRRIHGRHRSNRPTPFHFIFHTLCQDDLSPSDVLPSLRFAIHETVNVTFT